MDAVTGKAFAEIVTAVDKFVGAIEELMEKEQVKLDKLEAKQNQDDDDETQLDRLSQNLEHLERGRDALREALEAFENVETDD